MSRVRRRQFLVAVGVLLTSGLAEAQRPPKIPIIGLLDAGNRLEWWTAFRQQLSELGYAEGRNINIEARSAGGKLERLSVMAQELVRLDVAVIVTAGNAAALEARRATRKIPIVTATGADHVTHGLAVSFARPGRNVTGMTSITNDLTGKRLDLLREVLPGLSRLAVLWHADNLGSAGAIAVLEAAVESAKVSLQNLGVTSATEIADAFSAAARERAEAVFVVAGPLFFSERGRIAELALTHRLPTMHGPSEYVDAGGLLSYAANYVDLFRHAAAYVDKILKGAKPGNLAIQRPTKFELVVNLRTAKTLGLKIPQSLLLRADRVIE
jgi:putative ABC transport system substrate-binding protein